MRNNDTSKFQTEDNNFDKDYQLKAHHQTSFNEDIINNLAKKIREWYPHSENNPISILDLCCGHGEPDYKLLIKLIEKKVQVDKIVGYDISPAQIDIAKTQYKHVPQLSFQIQNVEMIENNKEFDIVISLFGLHWIENIEKTAELISKALKPKGHLMFFVPLEKMDLFEARKEFLKTPKWQQYFINYSLHPFIADENDYIKAFSKYFKSQAEHSDKKEIIYTKEMLLTFFSSWMQEVRYLKNQLKDDSNTTDDYLKELIDNILHKDNMLNVQQIDDEYICFTEHFFSYEGQHNIHMVERIGEMIKPETIGNIDASINYFYSSAP